MNTFDWLILFAIVYVTVGICFAIFFKQTPYGDNPLWQMVLLWPLYFWGL